MRIAFLSKRQYMRKDVIADRYARLYELPYQLALRGHDVLGLCLSYRRCEERDERHETGEGLLHWRGLAPGAGLAMGLLGYPRRAEAVLRAFKPDVLVGESDAPHIILTAWLARRLGLPYAIDLYDNFESFGLTRLPGMKSLYRRAIRQADVVSCVSEPLAGWVRDEYAARGTVIALPSTIDQSIFRPQDKAQCRANLGLPADALLVGTAGGLQADKGIRCVYEAFRQLAARRPDVRLVLAGGLDKRCPPPNDERVHYLGELPHARCAELFGALNVGIVFLQNTPYGHFSFPQKAYEMLACGTPITAARVGAMADLLAPWPQALYKPDDATDLARQLQAQLATPVRPVLAIDDWTSLAAKLEAALLQIPRPSL